MNVVTQTDTLVEKMFDMLAFMCIEYKSWDILLRLYKMLVRPLWKDVIKLERTQKRFISRLRGHIRMLSCVITGGWIGWDIFPGVQEAQREP